jgi:rSAM/selenodomain-associated transferase 1
MQPVKLIVFTRYPVPGQTKTRLIPRLGAVGAANFQRQLTEHMLTVIQDFMTDCQARDQPLDVEVRFTGGDRPAMAAWLGDRWCYRNQGEGDLGNRLHRTFSEAITAGYSRILAIGIDCPGITTNGLYQAVTWLQDRDLVLGPALDGGYYLIGMRHFYPELFQGIAWSTDQVLAQTLAIAHDLNLAIATLEPLADIDRPEDLTVWDALQSP